MKVSVETLSPVKRTLSVEVGAESVEREFVSAYAELGRRVKVPGFRRGRVPMGLLESRFSQEIEGDVVRRLVPQAYEEAIKEAGLTPVQLPTIEHVSVKRDSPLSFTATVEVRPFIELKSYVGLPLARPVVRVSDEDVSKLVEELRERHAQLESLPDDHSVVQGDYVVMDFEGRVDGRPLADASAKAYLVHVGSGAIMPELDAALIGRRKGDRFETQVTLPSDHSNRQLAGRAVLFQIDVVDIKRKVLPGLDDEFAKDLGMGIESLDLLRGKLREELERRRREVQRIEERRALLKLMLDQHEVALPPSLVLREAELMRDRIRRHLESEPQGPDLEALDQQANQAAEERVKGDLLLEAIAEREHIEVDQTEIERELERLARETRSSVHEVRKLVAGESGNFVGLRATLLREKTLDWLHARAEISETMEEDGPTAGLKP